MVDLLVRSSHVVGDADSICSLRAGISLALLWGLHPCWQCGGLMIYLREGCVSTGIVDASSIDQVNWWLPC